jgi:TIR domain
MAKRGGKAPIAFISYSWDSHDHTEWVRNFSTKLVENGVDVLLDQWHLARGESVTQFMESGIDKAEFIIVVCTPTYANKSNARKGGVGYEQQIISGHVASGLKRKRFVPVLRRGSMKPGQGTAIPSHLLGLFAVDLRTAERGEEEFEDLVRAIFAEPRHRPPPLGDGPMFARPPAQRERKPKSKALRLPDQQVDGFSLGSGVARAELSPETFHIPSASSRSRVSKGAFVKLMFEYPEDLSREFGGSGERMWVEIVGTKPPYLVGRLKSQPLAQDEGWPLTWGDRVLFLREHIIDIE